MHKSESTIKAWETPLPAGSEPGNLRDVSRLLKLLEIPAEVYIHCETDDIPVRPYHIRVLKLLDQLQEKQRRILIELMESMVEA